MPETIHIYLSCSINTISISLMIYRVIMVLTIARSAKIFHSKQCFNCNFTYTTYSENILLPKDLVICRCCFDFYIGHLLNMDAISSFCYVCLERIGSLGISIESFLVASIMYILCSNEMQDGKIVLIDGNVMIVDYGHCWSSNLYLWNINEWLAMLGWPSVSTT